MRALRSVALSFFIVLAFLANLAAQDLPTAKPAKSDCRPSGSTASPNG